MATSGTITKNFHSDKYSLILTWTESNVDTANNCSDITVVATLKSNSSSYSINSTASKNISITINGTTYSSTCTVGISGGGSKTLMSKTVADIPHGSDGSKSISISCTLGIAVTLSGTYYSSVTASGTAKLTTIARKSTMSVANGTLGTAQTLTVTRNSTSFSHSIKAVCGSSTLYIKENGSTATGEYTLTSTSISFTPPIEWAAQNTNGTSVTVTYTITTYNEKTSLGTNSYTKTYTIPASVVPTVSLTVADAMGYLATYGAYVQDQSKFAITATAAGAHGSTIDTYKLTANGQTYTTANATTDVIHSSGTLTISVTVTDSRGRTATASKTVTVIEYEKPKISVMTVQRCNSSGVADPKGTHLCATFTASVASLNSKNKATYTLRYKKKSDTSYTTTTLATYANNFAVTNGKHIFAASSTSSYDVELTLADAFTSVSNVQTGASASKLFSIFERGLGWAFGKYAERENALEIGLDIYDKHDTQIRNGLCAYGGASDGIDANTTIEQCFLTMVNTPTTNQFWYVQQFFYASKAETSNRMQVAFPYKADAITYHRYYFNGAWSKWLNDGLAAYPVGSYYIAHHDTSPAELFGGTWHRIESRFLWACPSTSTIGLTAGEQTHTLTTSEIPSHTHAITYTDGGTGSGWGYSWEYGPQATDTTRIASTGGGGAHNNMPPYVNCAIWRRTA